jgi:3-mercaptopyruvate sulfurtransferase SseA
MTDPEPQLPVTRSLVARLLLGLGREVLLALGLVAVAAVLGIGVNALRGRERGGIDLVARVPYDLYTDCPEMDANVPRLPASWVAGRSPLLKVIDARAAPAYLAGHLPGAASLPMYPQRPNAPRGLDELKRWIGFILVYGQDELQSAVHLASYLRQQGLKTVHLLEGDLAAWRAARRPLETTALDTVAAKDLLGRTRDVVLLDGRPREQFVAGHLPGARSLPFDGLVIPPQEIFRKLLEEPRRIVVYGVAGVDAELADPEAPAVGAKDVGALLAAELRALGARDVVHLVGGQDAWVQAGGALEKAPGGTP